MNFSAVPSLAPVLTKILREGRVEVAPGRVKGNDGRFYATVSIPDEEFIKLTADELFLLYLKPLTEQLGRRIIEYAGGEFVCTKALPLPGKKQTSVIGFRCLKGLVPVNVYVIHRAAPDRHQIIVDVLVGKTNETS